MDLGLAGHSVVVTGAGAGIGRACAIRLAGEGCHLTLGSREAAPLTETADVARRFGARVSELACDLTTAECIEALVSGARSAFGRIDGLVACVGSTPLGTFHALDDSLWQTAFEMKFLATVRAIRAVLPDLRAGGGRVVVIAGNAAHNPSARNATSGAMNAALCNLVASLARGFGAEGVGFNCINPGPTRTRRFEALRSDVMEAERLNLAEAEAAIAATMPDKRIGEPQEVADLAAFLLSPLASHINGTALAVDGGLSWSL